MTTADYVKEQFREAYAKIALTQDHIHEAFCYAAAQHDYKTMDILREQINALSTERFKLDELKYQYCKINHVEDF